MNFAQQTRRPSAAKIGLTPLIDVVFILLLFFMLTSTFTQRKNLDLAVPATAADLAPVDEPITLELNTQGLFNEDVPLAVEDIPARLQARLAKGDPVVINVADGVPLETSVAIMDVLKAAHARAVVLQRSEVTP
jgi:biopolymer transport protein ExbD